ncbi:expressed hypothetical protein [Thraustotheca clavata]|uniref:Cytochrome P450 n=1 Tax=Thraustotheca clavata TaxID=74557 RepID=A0A1V9ZXF3_9STRA|nr:expressed hypothetical protein [Thraustotheca clavata]
MFVQMSTLSKESILPFEHIRSPPEIGFGRFASNLHYFAKGEGMKKVFKQMQKMHNENGPIRFPVVPFASYLVSVADPEAPIGIVNTREYNEWKKLRPSLNDHLLRRNIIPTWVSRIDDVAHDVATRIQSEGFSNNGIATLNPSLCAFSLESLSSIWFDKIMGDLNIPIDSKAQEFTDAINGFFTRAERIQHAPESLPTFLYSYLPGYNKLVVHLSFFFDVAEQMVMEKINAKDSTGTDFLTLLLLWPELNKREAISQAIELLFGGLQIRTEVNMAKGPNDAIDEQSLGKLSCIRACVKEALWLHPPTIANMRTLVGLSSYVMSRDPNVFENPDAFIPERWFECENKLNRSNAAYSTTPFSMSARSCAGRRLAETEMYILLAHIVYTMKLRWLPNESLLEGKLQSLVPEKPITKLCKPLKG